MDVPPVPRAMRSLLTREVAAELAVVYGDQLVFPDRTVVDRPGDDERLFPGWPTPVLVISIENQGVCAWGVPLGDSDPPVLVGGELLDAPDATLQYAPSIESFIAARRWDAVCLTQEPLLQAQAAAVDAESLAVLRGRFNELPPTAGWPWAAQHRFENGTTRIMLWSGKEQCDWWISSADKSELKAVAKQLLSLSDLRVSMWSNDGDADLLLRELREHA
jgi:hypothetical protein